MRPASLFLASGLIVAIGCGPTPEVTTETTVRAARTLSETTTETIPPFNPPAGLVEAVTISIAGDGRDRADVIAVANEDEVGLFTSIASCSLVEGSGWFPLEIVAADRTGSFLRLWSHTYTPEGLGAIEGELIVRRPGRVSLAAAVTVFVGDGETSGSFTGTTDDGETIYCYYGGVVRMTEELAARSAAGEVLTDADMYLRSAPNFETSSEKYGWLNDIMAVGKMTRFGAGQLNYQVYEIL